MSGSKYIPTPQIRAFHAVALCGSFSAAAEMLHVSQPTVTAHVKELEERFGVELFFRHPRGASLTDVATGLLPIIQRIYVNQQEAVEFLSAVQGQQVGSLRVGSYGPFEVVDIVAAFKERWPLISVSIKLANSAELQEDLLGHRLDVAVFGRAEHHAEIHRLPYKSVNLIAIVAKSHPWHGRKSIRFDELVGQRIVVREAGSELRQTFDKLAASLDLNPDDILEIGSREGVMAMVAQNLGVATVFDEGLIPEQHLSKLQIDGVQTVNHIDVHCMHERKGNRNINAFLTVARQIAAPK